jgi:hypothetical protein
MLGVADRNLLFNDSQLLTSYSIDDDKTMTMEHWSATDSENRSTRKEPTPVSLCPPQIPHGLMWDQTQASVVRGR